MYRNVRQVGFIPVLQSFGPSPLAHWDMKVENGFARRVTDEQVRALALELSSTNVSTCYLRCPRQARASLGVFMRYLVLVVKNMNKYFTFEVTVLDDRNVHRRFRFSNFEKRLRVHHFSTSSPLCLKPGWNEIHFDLADITCKSYKSNYVETTRIQIHANCRLRVVYFCDSMYASQDVPQKLKMFLPVDHVARKKSKQEEQQLEPQNSELIAFRPTSYEDEFEAGGEEAYFEAAAKSELGEESKPASLESRRSLIIALPHGDEDEYLAGGYYDDADYQDNDAREAVIEEEAREDSADERKEEHGEGETEEG